MTLTNLALVLVFLLPTILCVRSLAHLDGRRHPIMLTGYVLSGTTLSLLTLCALARLIL